MNISLLTSEEHLRAYDAYVRAHPHGSLWQSLEWKKYQQALGREVRLYACQPSSSTVSALVTIDRTIAGYSVWEVPRGPLWDASKSQAAGALLTTISSDARKSGALSLLYSPPPQGELASPAGSPSKRLVHAEATILIDLRSSDEDILKQMQEKGRYNIRLAKRHGIDVACSTAESGNDDLESFYTLLLQTGRRDGFTIHPKRSYEVFLKNLDGSFLLIARYKKTPIAGLMGVIWNGTGIYYYGASSHEHRSLMAPYALQWEAMTLCKAAGCHTYDLLGIDPPKKSDGLKSPWSGITDFKRRFGGRAVEYPPEREITLRPLVHSLLKAKRKILG